MCNCKDCKIEEIINRESEGKNESSAMQDEYLDSDEFSDYDSPDECSEAGEDLHIENDNYSDAKNTDNEYSDQEENTLM